MGKRIYVSLVFVILLFSCPLPAQAAMYRDFLGRKVVVCSYPKRIISLAPSITEMIYFLGLGDRLVGVTRFSCFPEEARKKPKVGTYTYINVEKVITLDPDIVIATADGNRREDVEKLEEAGLQVYVVNPRKVNQVLDTIEKVGEVCGVFHTAKRSVSSLRKRVTRVVQAVRDKERPLVLLVINVKPLMSVNQSTTHHDLITLAGGQNLAGDHFITYPRLNMEEVLRKRPEVIIISSMRKGESYERASKEWLQWPTLPAVQKGNVYLIDSDLIDRAAPRIVSGLEEMAKIIHPEIEWDEK